MTRLRRIKGLLPAAALVMSAFAHAWEPTGPVEFIVPAGIGGGADQMARFIQGAVARHNLMKQPVVVINKSGNAGAEGYLDVKADKGNAHKLVITLSNLFTTPLGTGVPFNWRDLTPVQMLALDPFVLWVHADSPHKTARDFLAALRAGVDRTLKMGGTGARQEDQIITVMIEKMAGRKMTYVPFKGGGEVAAQLARRQVDATVNNPIEAQPLWRAGQVRPLCVLDKAVLPYRARVAAGQAWADVPTCASAGLPVDYQMLRGVFMPPGVSAEQLAFYVDLFQRLKALPEWQELMARGAFNTTALTGPALADWLARNEQLHRTLMAAGGLMVP